MKFYSVKNWDKYQHYKKKETPPPWIKFYRATFSSPDWIDSDDATRVLIIALLQAASATNNKIPDGKYLERFAYLNAPPNLEPLIESGFIIDWIDSDSSQSIDKVYNQSINGIESRYNQSINSLDSEEKRREDKEKRREEGASAPCAFSFSRFHRMARAGFQKHRPNVKQPDDQTTCRAEAAILEELLETSSEQEIGAVLKWLFNTDDDPAVFWRKHVACISDLAKKKRGDSMTRWDKILEAYQEADTCQDDDDLTPVQLYKKHIEEQAALMEEETA